MSKTPEGKIQSEIIKYLKENKIWYIRYNANITYGIPDLIVIYNGYFVGIEVKTPKGRATELQERMKDSIEKAGGYHIFATSVDDVYNLIRRIEKEHADNTERLSKANTK
jgi:Holliday junction resolvase-like predicted endonuclease